jgi:hypothetical protein
MLARAGPIFTQGLVDLRGLLPERAVLARPIVHSWSGTPCLESSRMPSCGSYPSVSDV